MVSSPLRTVRSREAVRNLAGGFGAGLFALLAGRAVAAGHAKIFLGAAVGLLVFPILLKRPSRPLLAAVGLLVLVPSWYTLGRAQLTAERASALLVLLALALGLYARSLDVRRHWVDLALLALIVYVWVGWALGPRLQNEPRLIVNYLLPFVFYFGARGFAGIRWSILWLLLGAGALASLTVYYEFFVAHRPLFVDAEAYRWLGDTQRLFRPGGVFGSPPAAATALAVSAFAGMALLTRAQGTLRLVVYTCIALDLGGVVVAFTRAPLIGLAAGTLAYLFVLRPRIWPRLVYATIGATLLGALVVLPQIERASWLQEGVLRKGTLAARQSYWHDSIPFVTNSTQHLWFGHGINSLFVGRPELPGMPSVDLTADPLLLQIGPHSQYVRTLLEGGVVGLGLVVAWLGGALLVGLRSRRRVVPAELPLVAFGVATLVMFGLVAAVGDALRIQSSAGLVALAAGMLVTSVTRRHDEEEA